MRLLLSWIVLLLSQGAQAMRGLDASVPLSASNLTCLQKELQMEYVIPRVYRCVGAVDEQGVQTFAAARAINTPSFTFVDGYIFPCISDAPYNVQNNHACVPPAQQVDDMLQALQKSGISTAGLRLWLDVEDERPSKYYSPIVETNVQFIQEMTVALQSRGVEVGVYTTKSYWQQIMGNALGWGSYPLWYPRYDAVESMAFFSPFADWTSVLIKQTAGDTKTECGGSVDVDYMEG